MNRIPAITFELLRGGPPHNQLISPITDYLALCGDASPHVLRLPFEHRDLIDRLSRLRYTRLGGTDGERAAEIHRLGRDMGAVLGSVPAFASELSGLRADGDEIVTVRLVLAGNELSLLPWEVAHIPAGLPGAGLPLLLNPGAPVSLIREVRGASRRRFQWDTEPRILFIAADASEFPAGTVRAHLLALYRSLERWAYRDWMRNGWQVDYPIEVIERASIEKIRNKCLEKDFTHVHVLAHGQPLKEGSEQRFGVRLHHSKASGQMEIITGEQLAQTLRVGCGARDASDPVFVCLATCDSANLGSVEVPGGGSVAHELHQYGIPWVVASQLPLTVGGSVVLADDLYHHLLRGEDPRKTLQCLRSHLSARFADRHDWGALVVYASTPSEFGRQVEAFRDRTIRANRYWAYSLVDLLILKEISERTQGTDKDPFKGLPEAFWSDVPTPERARAAVEEVCNAFETERRHIQDSDDRSEVKEWRLAKTNTDHAALLKRLAELKWLFPRQGDDWVKTLKDARRRYLEGSIFRNGTDHWAIGQYLVLCAVLDPRLQQRDRSADVKFAADDFRRWVAAWNATETHLEAESSDDRMWAHATRADLIMVAIAYNKQPPFDAYRDLRRRPLEVLRRSLEDMVRAGDDAIWPTFRQFWRYHRWWKLASVAKWNAAAEDGYAFLLEKVRATYVARAIAVRTTRDAADRQATSTP